MVKIQRLPNGQLVLTLPKRLAELRGWDKGTILTFLNHETGFIITALPDAKKPKRGGRA